MRPLNTLGIVGAGAMGRGIAQIAAQAGCSVLLFDQQATACAAAVAAVRDGLDKLVARRKLAADEAGAAVARITVAASLEQLAGCDAVVEAIVERLDAKQALLRALEALVGPDAVLASNTSSLSITQLAAGCQRPARVVGWHFFNPVPLMKVVEVVPGVRTDPRVVEAMVALSRRLGHAPVVARDAPGFIVNHAGRGYVTESLKLLQEGVADVPTLDAILRDAAGFRMGPFELMDLTALDVSHPVMESIYRQFYDDARYRPSWLAAQRLAGGLLGRKVGEGFYRYGDGQPGASPAPEAPLPPLPADAAFHVDPRAGARGAAVSALLQAAGARLVDRPGAVSGAGPIVVCAPLGEDATTCATTGGFDPARCVAIDAMLPIGTGQAKRRVLMGTPVTRTDVLAAARAAFGADGVPVSVIADSPGFVVQRVLAMVVAIACEMAQQRIGTPADIDTAVRLGLGYPQGPLAWGGAIGAGVLEEVLRNLQAAFGDARYRPSPWLRRCAQLGLAPADLPVGVPGG